MNEQKNELSSATEKEESPVNLMVQEAPGWPSKDHTTDRGSGTSHCQGLLNTAIQLAMKRNNPR